METLLFIALALLAYVYLVFPLLLAALSMLPAAELTRVTMEELRAHVGGDAPK